MFEEFRVLLDSAKPSVFDIFTERAASAVAENMTCARHGHRTRGFVVVLKPGYAFAQDGRGQYPKMNRGIFAKRPTLQENAQDAVDAVLDATHAN